VIGLLRYWKLALGAALLAALLWGVHSYGVRRYKAGEAARQALWEADAHARDKATADAIAAVQERERQAVAHNVEVIRDANEKLVAIAADRESLAGRVRDYENSLRRLSAGQATSQLGADVGAGIAARAAAVDAAYDAYDRACQRDAVRFGALQDQIRGQL